MVKKKDKIDKELYGLLKNIDIKEKQEIVINMFIKVNSMILMDDESIWLMYQKQGVNREDLGQELEMGNGIIDE